jgi:hypothetical protein
MEPVALKTLLSAQVAVRTATGHELEVSLLGRRQFLRLLGLLCRSSGMLCFLVENTRNTWWDSLPNVDLVM